MSDPMTNRDVEDVLASIRRLVSDDARTGSAPVQRPPSDRLVLTPSLRVTDEQDAAVDDVHGDAEIDVSEAEDAEDTDLSAFAQSAFGQHETDSVHPDAPQNGFAVADEAAVFATLTTALSKSEDDDNSSSDVDVAAATEHGETPFSASDLEESHDEGTETDVAFFPDHDGETPMHDEGEDAIFHDASDDASLRDEEDDARHQDQVEEAPFIDVDDEAPFVDLDETEVPIVPEDWEAEPARPAAEKKAEEPERSAEDLEPAAATLSEKIAALETLVGERRDRFEPDDPGADAYAGTEPPAMEWEDEEPKASPHVDAHVEDVFEDTVEAEPEFETTETSNGTASSDLGHNETDGAPEPDHADVVDAPLGLFAGDDDVLDEDALRELISDIVREELQGALGERITRNVRKLVRREIHRALAAQDLE